MEGVEEKKNPIDENYAVNVVYPCRPDQTLRTTTVTSIGIRSNLGRARSVFRRSERVPGLAPPVRSEAAAVAPYFTRYVRWFGRSVAPQCDQPSSAYHATAAAAARRRIFFTIHWPRTKTHRPPLPSHRDPFCIDLPSNSSSCCCWLSTMSCACLFLYYIIIIIIVIRLRTRRPWCGVLIPTIPVPIFIKSIISLHYIL